MALKDLPHGWQSLSFDQGFLIGWRNRGGWPAMSFEVITDYLCDNMQRHYGFLNHLYNEFALLIGDNNPMTLWCHLGQLYYS